MYSSFDLNMQVNIRDSSNATEPVKLPKPYFRNAVFFKLPFQSIGKKRLAISRRATSPRLHFTSGDGVILGVPLIFRYTVVRKLTFSVQ